MDTIFHYPPDLLSLLISAIPVLSPSKRDVFVFFQGAGVASDILAAPLMRFRTDPKSIGKYEIAREVLTSLNERGDAAVHLRARREIVKRVVEFENFGICWDNDRDKAKALVADIRTKVNVKDSFTRMDEARERERRERIEMLEKENKERETKRRALADVQRDLSALFGEPNPQKRGKQLEGILNRLFEHSGVLVLEAFTIVGESAEGIVEQIDGLISVDGQHYLVEVKWLKEPLGKKEVSEHLVRAIFREGSRAILVSASGYSGPVVEVCRDFLQQRVVVLAELEEIVTLLERGVELKTWLKQKVDAAIGLRNPFFRPFRD